jgi:hypothetical protein
MVFITLLSQEKKNSAKLQESPANLKFFKSKLAFIGTEMTVLIHKRKQHTHTRTGQEAKNCREPFWA